MRSRKLTLGVVPIVMLAGWLMVAWSLDGSPASGQPRPTVTIYPTATPPPAPASPAASPTAAPTVSAPIVDTGYITLIKRIKSAVVFIVTYNDLHEKLGTGSGFFIGPNTVVTNCHVIDRAGSADVKTLEGETLPVLNVLAYDRDKDVAKLEVKAPIRSIGILPTAKRLPVEGEKIIVVGAPLGLEQTVSDGIVSSLRDKLPFGKVVQITAPISPGSSGGPVVNLNGEVVGVICFTYLRGQNLNFSIPGMAIDTLPAQKKVSLTQFNSEPLPSAVSSNGAALAVQSWVACVNGQNYESAFNLMTRVSRDTLIKAVRQSASGISADEALQAVTGGLDDRGVWKAIRRGLKTDQLAAGSYRVEEQEEDHAYINVILPDRSKVTFLVKQEDGFWKVGVEESLQAQKAK